MISINCCGRKTSKGKLYITRRKKQVEKSLGPYDENLLNRIKNIQEKHKKDRPKNEYIKKGSKRNKHYKKQDKNLGLRIQR